MTENFGEELKQLLKERGITQKQFAKAVGLTEATVSRYVKGTRYPDYQMLVKMESALKGFDIKTQEGFVNIQDDRTRTMERIIEIEKEIDKLLKEKTLLLESL